MRRAETNTVESVHQRRMPSIYGACRWVMGRCIFGKAPLMRGFYTRGNDRLIVVTGDNGSGKSMLRRAYVAWAHGKMKEKVKVLSSSMEFRAGGGLERAFCYGGEDWEATGIISAQAFMKIVASSVNMETPHLVVLDESDLG